MRVLLRDGRPVNPRRKELKSFDRARESCRRTPSWVRGRAGSGAGPEFNGSSILMASAEWAHCGRPVERVQGWRSCITSESGVKLPQFKDAKSWIGVSRSSHHFAIPLGLNIGWPVWSQGSLRQPLGCSFAIPLGLAKPSGLDQPQRGCAWKAQGWPSAAAYPGNMATNHPQPQRGCEIAGADSPPLFRTPGFRQSVDRRRPVVCDPSGGNLPGRF